MRYFKCDRKGGCRLTDLNLNLIEGQLFSRDNEVIESSRSVTAAKNSQWIKELNEKQYKEIMETR